MSATYATPLILDVKPSRRVRDFIVLINLLAVLSILLLPLAPGPALALCALLVMAGVYTLGRCRGHYRLIWQESGWLIREAGQECPAELLPSSFVTPWLAILNFRTTRGRTLSVPLLMDCVDGDSFRRLRVRLRVEGLKENANERE